MMLERVSNQRHEKPVQVLIVNDERVAPEMMINPETTRQPDFLYRGIKSLTNLKHSRIAPPSGARVLKQVD